MAIEEPKETPEQRIIRILKGWGLVDPEGMFPAEEMEKEYKDIARIILKALREIAQEQGIKIDF